ncbi:MAG: CvpA family protein [Bacteroides sp.]|nr:CvpA family protein [Bacteroides sp.]
MDDALFHIIALGVAAWGVIRGYRRGLTGMVTSVLGMAFGIVCSHIFVDASTEIMLQMLSTHATSRGAVYLASNLGCGAVFFLVYFLFRSVTGIIRTAMAAAGSGLLDSLLGTMFCVANYLLMLSICYNVYIGIHPDSALMRYGKADDGNICAAVVWLAPAALGSESFSQFAHEEQLREAKKISLNRRVDESVVHTYGFGEPRNV